MTLIFLLAAGKIFFTCAQSGRAEVAPGSRACRSHLPAFQYREQQGEWTFPNRV